MALDMGFAQFIMFIIGVFGIMIGLVITNEWYSPNRNIWRWIIILVGLMYMGPALFTLYATAVLG